MNTKGMFYTNVSDYENKEDMMNDFIALRMYDMAKDKEIERLKNELEVSKNNEETYRLEMLDITKRLGLDEETLFDDVKDKAERLNKIIDEFNKLIENEINESKLEEDYDRVDAMEYCLATLRELKGEDKKC